MLARRHRVLRLAALVIAHAAAAGTAIAAPGGSCERAVTAENTRALFDHLKAMNAGDGCVLDGVRGERERILVTWKKGQRALDPIVLAPTGCVKAAFARGKALSIVSAPSADSACPATLAAMKDLVGRETFGDFAAVDRTPPESGSAPQPARRPFRPPRAAFVVAFGAAALGGMFVLQRRRRRRSLAGLPAGARVAGEVSAARRRPKPAAVAAVLGACLLAVLAALVVIRADRPDVHRANARFDSEIGWVPDCMPDKPGCQVEKTVGQRLDRPDPAKEHIVLLGDSVAYGHGLGDTEHMGAALGRIIKDPRYQVVNAAVSGYAIDQYYLYLERILPLLKPRVVVVNVFTGNDYQGTVHDNNYGYVKPLFKLEGDLLVRANPVLREQSCASYLSKSLGFYLMWRWALSGRDVDHGSGRRERVLQLLKGICGTRDLSTEEGPKVIRKLFEAIDGLAKGRHAGLMFVLLPRMYDGTPRETQESDEHWRPPWPTMTFFQDMLGSTPYEVIDFSRILNGRFCRPGSDGGRPPIPPAPAGAALACDYAAMATLFLDGAHYTAEGNAYLAATLHEHLGRRFGIE